MGRGRKLAHKPRKGIRKLELVKKKRGEYWETADWMVAVYTKVRYGGTRNEITGDEEER